MTNKERKTRLKELQCVGKVECLRGLVVEAYLCGDEKLLKEGIKTMLGREIGVRPTSAIKKLKKRLEKG